MSKGVKRTSRLPSLRVPTKCPKSSIKLYSIIESMSRTIYGTHNSCTYGPLLNQCLCVVTPWVRNQTWSITQQLEKGIRWFDFRVSIENGTIYLSHTYLMEHTLKDILDETAEYLKNKPDCPFLLIHLRVDSHALANQALIEPLVRDILSSYASICIDKDAFDTSIPLLQNNTTGKILFYNSNATLSHPSIFSSDLMPSVYGWDTGSMAAFDERLLQMDAFYAAQTQPFLYPNERMIIFDYSSNAPLWYTDRQQVQLMQKHKELLKHLTIMAGNEIEDWLAIFGE